MAEKSKSYESAHDLENTFDVSVNDLESTLQNFIEEDEASVKKTENLLNPITMAGLAILAISSLWVIQNFIPINVRMDEILGFIIVVGGILMLLTGLGMFTRPKRKKKKPAKVMSDGRATDVYGLERKKKLFKCPLLRKKKRFQLCYLKKNVEQFFQHH
jgi:hypothetical protein